MHAILAEVQNIQVKLSGKRAEALHLLNERLCVHMVKYDEFTLLSKDEGATTWKEHSGNV